MSEALMEATVGTLKQSKNRFVVLHSGLGRFRKGQVVSQEELGGPGDVLRLLSLKAIRTAHGGEANEDEVALPEADVANLSYNQKLAEKDQQILALQEEVRNLRDEATRSAPHLEVALDSERAQSAALLREKDRMIVDAQSKNALLQQQHAELQKQYRDKKHECDTLAAKLALMEGGTRTPSADEVRQKLAAMTGMPAPGTEQDAAQHGQQEEIQRRGPGRPPKDRT